MLIDESVRLLGGPEPLISALKRLAKDNLANLHPHPLFAGFYYSHPPLAGRIARLRLHSPPNLIFLQEEVNYSP